MLNAIRMGIMTNSTKERLDELEAEKKKPEPAIAEETLEHPDVPKEYFEQWLRHNVPKAEKQGDLSPVFPLSGC